MWYVIVNHVTICVDECGVSMITLIAELISTNEA